MDSTLTLAELLERDAPIACADAVAVAQLLISEPDISVACPPYGPPSIENVALSVDGSIRCLHTAATPSLVEVALLLQTLVARTADRVPGGLRYAIGRALLEVEAPPFDTTADFSAALARFEQGSRRDRVKRLVLCATQPEVATVNATSSDVQPSADRRRHEPAPSELRRQLREADLRLYEMCQKAASNSGQTRRARRLPRAPIAACMAAGMVLVAVGEFTALPGRRPDTPRPPLASTPIRTASELPTATSIAVASSSVPSIFSERRSDAVSVGSRRAGAPRSSRPNLARPASASASSSSRSVREPRASGRERDRDVIARVRFEWKNPFR